MTSQRWDQIEKLYHAALEKEPGQRSAFLKEGCTGDEDLRREVESLLAADAQAEDFIESPALEMAAQALSDAGPPSLVGKKLGAYQILAPLGAGGMGEVYKARDTRLNRSVAIKILPRHLSERVDLRQRFEREARALARLSHPHICPIHDIGKEDGIDFLVMEYLEGETLARRLKKGAIPLAEALRYAVEIASALDEAHRHGIIHRDLKPGNIMLTKSGAKLLDFGLAKQHVVAGLGEAGPGPTAPATESLTEEGMILGTLEYMAPEQVEGKEADARTDIFALGVVIFEMVTGKKAFEAESKTSLMAAILSSEPPSISELQPRTPPALERLIERCLKKDPEERWQTVRDLASELKWIAEQISPAKATKVEIDQGLQKKVVRRARRSKLLVGVGLLSILAGGSVWLYFSRSRELPPMKVVRLTSFPGKEIMPSLSPDGRMVAFAWNGDQGDRFDIYVMLIEAGRPLPLTTGPADHRGPTWSPDGRYIAFIRVATEKSGIYLVPSLGGPERKLLEEDPSVFLSRKMDWSPDGKYLAISKRNSDEVPRTIFLLSVESGEKKQLSFPPSQPGDMFPSFSPDGQTIAFTRVPGVDNFDIYTTPVHGGDPKRLTFNNISGNSVWTPDGRELIFSRPFNRGGLYRIPAAGGKATPLAEGGQFADFPSISRQGNRLVYSEGIEDLDIWEVELKGSAGGSSRTKRLISSSQGEDTAQFSPDGKRIVFDSDRSGSPEIWICDRDGRNPVQLTSFGQPFTTGTPRWSPDGRWIAFDSRPKGLSDIFVISADGGSPRCLTEEASDDMVPSWSRDGHWIYYGSNRSGKSDWQIWKIALEGGEPVQVTRNGGMEASESFDRKFIYYTKIDFHDLWRIPVSGGEETLFLQNNEKRYWVVAERGIYFIRNEGGVPWIKFIDFTNQQVTSITRLDKKLPWSLARGLALSPDGRSLLCTLVEQDSSDIMLIENFR